MTLSFNRKIALFGLLTLLFVAVLSCGQLYGSNIFDMGTSECSIVTSTTSFFSSREFFALTGTLLLLIVLNTFIQRLPWQERFYTFSPPEDMVVFILKQIRIIPSQIQEAFRKGIIHSQTYGDTMASD